MLITRRWLAIVTVGELLVAVLAFGLGRFTAPTLAQVRLLETNIRAVEARQIGLRAQLTRTDELLVRARMSHQARLADVARDWGITGQWDCRTVGPGTGR